MALKLIIGNKNYSSWSLRPWIAMKVAGIAFEERVVSLNDVQFKRLVGEISPAGKVRLNEVVSSERWYGGVVPWIGDLHMRPVCVTARAIRSLPGRP